MTATGPDSHLRLWIGAAVSVILSWLRTAGNTGSDLATRFPFLSNYALALGTNGPRAQDEIATWEARHPGRWPLVRLRRQLALDGDALLLLALAGIVEEDLRFGSLFAALQEPLPA